MANENLLKRLIFIFLGIPLVLFIIFFQVKFNILIFIFLIILIFLSAYEYYFCLKSKNLKINLILFIFQSIIIITSFFLYSNRLIESKFLFFLLISILLSTSFFYIFKNNISLNALTLFLHIFGLIYITVSISSILIFYSKINYSPNLFLFFLTIFWSSNIFGYVVGMFWLPRTPLNLEVSPNKSIKGFVGAIFFGTLIPFLLYIFLQNFFIFNIKNNFFVLALILTTNIFSIIGDLFESAFKRFCGVKDSSNYLKGFGGILDTIDSILFSFPFYFSFLMLLIN